MVYRCEYGRGKRITIGRTTVLSPAQARDKAKQILSQAAIGVLPVKEKAQKLTLETFINNEYEAWRKERGYDCLPELRDLTFADYLTPMILVALNTGIRRGELFNLTWDDVNFARATITVNGDTSKSGKTRHIALNATALQALKGWREASSCDGLIFSNFKTGEAFTHVKKSWSGLLEDANIKNFRWHDMRHHFASKLVIAGVDLNTVRELLGHADIKMTLRYAHLAPEHKAKAVEKLVEELY